jgi:hypothetical protein
MQRVTFNVLSRTRDPISEGRAAIWFPETSRRRNEVHKPSSEGSSVSLIGQKRWNGWDGLRQLARKKDDLFC